MVTMLEYLDDKEEQERKLKERKKKVADYLRKVVAASQLRGLSFVPCITAHELLEIAELLSPSLPPAPPPAVAEGSSEFD